MAYQMDPRIKELWTTALRSKQYTQGKMRLLNEDGSVCCLMVLCKLAEAEGICKMNGYAVVATENDTDYSTVVLPEAVMRWAGLASVTGEYHSVDEDGEVFDEELTEANDYRDKSFEQIADIIEAKL